MNIAVITLTFHNGYYLKPEEDFCIIAEEVTVDCFIDHDNEFNIKLGSVDGYKTNIPGHATGEEIRDIIEDNIIKNLKALGKVEAILRSK